jgi:GDSL-like Lipase/Acylhydrolase family
METPAANEDAGPAPDPAPPRSRRRLGWRKRLAFVGLALALGTLMCEGALRLAGFPRGLIKSTKKMWATDEERVLGPFKPLATVTVVWPPELGYTVHTNGLGLRGPEVEDDGRPRVLCVGDSTTFGSHVADDETYPRYLEAALEGRAQVINGGCPRWTITDQNEFLADALPRLSPQVVVLLFCGNDLIELDKDSARERALDAHDVRDVLASRLAIPEAVLWLSLELRRAQLEAKGEWPKPMRPDQGRTGEWAEAYWGRYEEELAKTIALTDEHGARLIVAAFPGFLEVEVADRCEIEENLSGLCARTGVTYADVYPAFRADPQGKFLLPHDAHASAAGNALLAQALTPAVLAAGGWR